jgi:hypothetical protein
MEAPRFVSTICAEACHDTANEALKAATDPAVPDRFAAVPWMGFALFQQGVPKRVAT